ncbi:MAG: ABC transporter permease [Candidatus Bathyarchaeia archaeon]|jgi:ABC-2 type transport system permease protein
MIPLIRDTASIAGKELKQLSRDPLALVLTIMFPILLIGNFIVIGSAFRATSHDIPAVVANLDDSPASAELLNKLTTSRLIHVTQVVQTQAQAFRVVDAGAAVGAVVIPAGFGIGLARGHTYVVAQLDFSKATSAQIMSGEVRLAIRQVLEEAKHGELNFQVQLATVEVITIPISGRPPTGDIIMPGFLGIIVTLGAFDDTVNAISRERDRGTFPRLILTPVSMFSIYSGKMAATVVLTVLRTGLMLLILSLNGLVVRGSLLLVFLTTLLIAMFTLSLGLVISSRIRSSSTLTVLEIAMTFPLFSLAGTGQSPLLLAPGGKAIALALPWSYGNDALRRIIYLGLGLPAVGGDLLLLLICSLILMPVAIRLSTRTM